MRYATSYIYYPPVHPKISECQGLSCPLVMCSKVCFCDNIWFGTLVMFFVFGDEGIVIKVAKIPNGTLVMFFCL